MDLFLGDQTVCRQTFTSDECRLILQRIDALHEHWVKLVPESAFFTLGAPAYQFGTNDASIGNYHTRAIATNQLLWDEFSWVYLKLREMISDLFGIRAEHYFSLALPGFHIFPEANCFYGGDIHCDLSYYSLQTPERGVAHREHISIIVPLELPSSNCGIEIWEPRVSRFDEMDAHVARIRYQAPTRKLQYSPGHVVIFSGFLPHRISPYVTEYQNARRITLQAHMVQIEGIWVMYW